MCGYVVDLTKLLASHRRHHTEPRCLLEALGLPFAASLSASTQGLQEAYVFLSFTCFRVPWTPGSGLAFQRHSGSSRDFTFPSLFFCPSLSAKDVGSTLCVLTIMPPHGRAEAAPASFGLKYHLLPSPHFPHGVHLMLSGYLMSIGGERGDGMMYMERMVRSEESE